MLFRSGHDLATRLSFFIWSRPPDEPLLALAASGRLLEPSVLEEQTRRMLADPRSQALADNFLGQWLDLRDLDDHQVDAARFPEFDADLRDAIRAELRGLLGDPRSAAMLRERADRVLRFPITIFTEGDILGAWSPEIGRAHV